MENELVTFDGAKLALIKSMYGKDLNDTEFNLYISSAKARGLDPVLNQIHAVKRAGKMTIQVGIDGFRLIAARTEDYAGRDEAIFEYSGDRPTKVKLTVYKIVRGLRCGFTATARWDEYYPGDAQGFMWKKMPETMLEKVCEAKALRMAFPGDLSGLYVHEEMEQADKVIEKTVQPKPIQNLAPKFAGMPIPHVDQTVEEPAWLREEPSFDDLRPAAMSVPDFQVPSGKFKGRMAASIPSNDLGGYIDWLKKNSDKPLSGWAKELENQFNSRMK